ncbi:nucleoside-diphosphate-sugar epimerase [Longilinea arvoryzae]|uniref:Nucleoside-diphosphate-sugar epimerase n=1 Tax=Longilinea arvoryzae TaxID=360412 RepID=A0A0S7BJY4_9CHLR|nr:NAD-dependent epimerase/dehydratase family protein [Longilinea arvoryzae]GAP14806.1 nucleoside-diphosphate-sugar epimerase [Longilinea arvoryzae]
MRILILGGTVFLGRALVDVALEQGHEITLFNRGRTNPNLFPGIEKRYGTRDGDLVELEGGHWDAVLDTSGYVPAVVRKSAHLLARQTDHYVFISTLSVYADVSEPDIDENAPVARLADESVSEVNGDTYGPLKAACEREVIESMLDRALIVRPGLIVGPYDQSDRFTYWAHRLARGGEILAPGRPDREIQYIDVRDLAEWLVRMVENQVTGVFNAVGPAVPLTMKQLLEAGRKALNKHSVLTWVEDEFLLKKHVDPWIDLPLWLPDSDHESNGLFRINARKAWNAGLVFRPVEETFKATSDWDAGRPGNHDWKAGLSIDRENDILRSWHLTQQT